MEASCKWVGDCILSSTNGFNFDCCLTLIELFGNMYKDEPNVGEAVRDLRYGLDQQMIKHGVEI